MGATNFVEEGIKPSRSYRQPQPVNQTVNGFDRGNAITADRPLSWPKNHTHQGRSPCEEKIE